ncbi:hypothetical protein [Tuwongella immobilis]|uniref:Uncharacterized protein n=1 Tax=Tuwongella immobilis TaxID=692036 RepID=A0A6C2YI40_9BACT|nr:hypothetical protein [Tuwongella immobilis]VIP01034.1 Uncharacterized protein OS=Singulisphaera acidiphila (strain ATCC BAA-1392 / DSM 18658 / VKM B-2454 / MOB10) GN=Sinac_2118 PE=4 SV=1 [Tuwongella immobilis]VTR97493.1 Uncharacterized protein OS=Singulisphaera acidiphila (strain ATCC BAA-1392 / DSM 18658 / VKM B-2454 / MOB10) GN=Sinac_2118 PE=4 SV=1 [Tuwongella immobilis]
MIDPYRSYLTIPAPVALWLGGVTWSATGEALEWPDGRTFALTPQIALFLEGFAMQKRVIPFGQIVVLLACLGLNRQAEQEGTLGGEAVGCPPLFAEVFRQTGSQLRNAGALAGMLCLGIPPAHRVPDGGGRAVASWLQQSMSLATLSVSDSTTVVELPRLSPLEFYQRMRAGWERLSIAERIHWFQHGRAPLPEVPTEAVQPVVEVRPTAQEMLTELLQERTRLKPARHLMPHLQSALSFPPRKLESSELPSGGYSDVTNRGTPDRLLLSQFALDAEELIRRFAERELLYHRREESPQSHDETLLVVLDQGVRTWGNVRLGLTAAVAVLLNLGDQRGMRLELVVSSDPEKRYSLDELALAELGDLLEDASLQRLPLAAVQGLFRDAESTHVDLVVLTHPRSLAEMQQSGWMQAIPADVRCFGLLLDETGLLQFGPIPDGQLQVRSRCQLQWDFPDESDAPEPESDDGRWTGQAKGFQTPFSLPLSGEISGLFWTIPDEHLLVVTNRSELILVRSPVNNADAPIDSQVVLQGQKLPQFMCMPRHDVVPFDFVMAGIGEIFLGIHLPIREREPTEQPVLLRLNYERRTLHQLALDRSRGRWMLDSDANIVHWNEFRTIRIAPNSLEILSRGGHRDPSAGISSGMVRSRFASASSPRPSQLEPPIGIPLAMQRQWQSPTWPKENPVSEVELECDCLRPDDRLTLHVAGHLELHGSQPMRIDVKDDGIVTLQDCSFGRAVLRHPILVVPIYVPRRFPNPVSVWVFRLPTSELPQLGIRVLRHNAGTWMPPIALNLDGSRMAWMPTVDRLEILNPLDGTLFVGSEMNPEMTIERVVFRDGMIRVETSRFVYEIAWGSPVLRVNSWPKDEAPELFGESASAAVTEAPNGFWRVSTTLMGRLQLCGDLQGNWFLRRESVREHFVIRVSGGSLDLLAPDGEYFGERNNRPEHAKLVSARQMRQIIHRFFETT